MAPHSTYDLLGHSPLSSDIDVASNILLLTWVRCVSPRRPHFGPQTSAPVPISAQWLWLSTPPCPHSSSRCGSFSSSSLELTSPRSFLPFLFYPSRGCQLTMTLSENLPWLPADSCLEKSHTPQRGTRAPQPPGPDSPPLCLVSFHMPFKGQALVKPNHSQLLKTPCSIRLLCICTRGVSPAPQSTPAQKCPPPPFLLLPNDFNSSISPARPPAPSLSRWDRDLPAVSPCTAGSALLCWRLTTVHRLPPTQLQSSGHTPHSINTG